MKRTPENLGFSPEDMSRLVSMAQEHYAPDEFSQEVQKHLEAMGAIEPTESDQESAREENQAEAISDLSEGTKPPVPAPGSKTIPKNPPVMKDATAPPIPGAPPGDDNRSAQIAGTNAVAQTPKKKSSLPSKAPNWDEDLK
jgi:hypothetical protein